MKTGLSITLGKAPKIDARPSLDDGMIWLRFAEQGHSTLLTMSKANARLLIGIMSQLDLSDG